MDMERFVEELRQAEKVRTEALAELTSLLTALKAIIEKLGGAPKQTTRTGRGTGRGVSQDEALRYAERVKRETPSASQEEVEARVTQLAREAGKSTKGLLARLRAAMEKDGVQR